MKKTVLFILGTMIIMCLVGCGGQKSKPVLKNNGSVAEKSASSAKEEAADTSDDDADAEKPADEDTAGTDTEGKKVAVDTDKADAEKTDASEDSGDTDKAGDAENADDAGASGDLITEVQAVDAITDYCYEQNPDLKDIVEAGEYPVYWDISSSDDKEIVVVFRSYTGALTYYHIDPATGDTYVTEVVPGIIDEEQRTDETLNVRDYIK